MVASKTKDIQQIWYEAQRLVPSYWLETSIKRDSLQSTVEKFVSGTLSTAELIIKLYAKYPVSIAFALLRIVDQTRQLVTGDAGQKADLAFTITKLVKRLDNVFSRTFNAELLKKSSVDQFFSPMAVESFLRQEVGGRYVLDTLPVICENSAYGHSLIANAVGAVSCEGVDKITAYYNYIAIGKLLISRLRNGQFKPGGMYNTSGAGIGASVRKLINLELTQVRSGDDFKLVEFQPSVVDPTVLDFRSLRLPSDPIVFLVGCGVTDQVDQDDIDGYLLKKMTDWYQQILEDVDAAYPKPEGGIATINHVLGRLDVR